MKTFKIINGKWQIGNIYDALTNSSFDLFINLKRENQTKKQSTVNLGKNLKKHNYEFTSRN